MLAAAHLSPDFRTKEKRAGRPMFVRRRIQILRGQTEGGDAALIPRFRTKEKRAGRPMFVRRRIQILRGRTEGGDATLIPLLPHKREASRSPDVCPTAYTDTPRADRGRRCDAYLLCGQMKALRSGLYLYPIWESFCVICAGSSSISEQSSSNDG